MSWIIANTFSKYVNYVRSNKELGRTRYVGAEQLYGVRGEVIILNDGHTKFDTTAQETLLAYKSYGLIKLIFSYGKY